ncbi:MAG: cation-transporting P-type ATPase [Acidobacteriota bacterium]|nr:cation-transporting P-type ATPase [Acidobacteriota bacterium]
MVVTKGIEVFWSLSPDSLMKQLGSSPVGLTNAEARRRLQIYGPNRLRRAKSTDVATLLLAQFKAR